MKTLLSLIVFLIIGYMVEAQEVKNNRMVYIWAEKYEDGNISYTIGIWNAKGDKCNWINGTLYLYIKDGNGKVIKTHKKVLTAKHPVECEQKEPFLNVYMGLKINQAKSIDAKYIGTDGNTYWHKKIQL